MAVIKVIDDNKSATKELMNCKEGNIVYHTANEKITIEVKNIEAIEIGKGKINDIEIFIVCLRMKFNVKF